MGFDRKSNLRDETGAIALLLYRGIPVARNECPVWESGSSKVSAASAWAPALRQFCHLALVGQGLATHRALFG